jgi:hypothetical protein
MTTVDMLVSTSTYRNITYARDWMSIQAMEVNTAVLLINVVEHASEQRNISTV